MVSPIAALDLVGAVGFLAATALAVRFYRDRPLYRNYWLSWVIAMLHLGLWAAAELVARLGVAPATLDGSIQPLVLAVALGGLLHIALYDNTGTQALLERVRVSERRNGAIVEHFPDGSVVLFDDRLRVLLAGGTDLPGVGAAVGDVEGARLTDAFPDDLVDRLRPPCRAALDGESSSFDLSRNGSTYEVRTLPVSESGSEGGEGMAVFRDVTERERRERTLREQRDELTTLDRINRLIRKVDHALVGAGTREEVYRDVADCLAADPYRSVLVASLSGGRFAPEAWGGGESAADAFPAALDADAPDPGSRAAETGQPQVVRGVAGGSPTDPWRRSARDLGATAVAVVPVRHGDRTFGVVAVYADGSDAFDEREVAVLDQLGETIGYALAAIERRERADLLAELHRVARDLLRAETHDAVGEVVVDAGTSLLDVEIAVFRYDDETHELRPLTASERALEFYEDAPAYSGDRQSLTWQTFTSGETRAFDDVRTAEALSNPETAARGAMFVPLGDHGVLAVGSTERGAFDDQGRRLVELLAATTEAAFDRVESEADLREREAQLRERNETLRRLQRLNDTIRDVDQALVGATSRAEIEQSVPDRLTADDRFRFACLCGPRTDDDDPPSPRAWAGEGVEYLDRAPFDPDAPVPEPTVGTLATGEPTVVANLADHVRESEWAARGLDSGFTSAVSVPVVYRGIEYGALTVYAADPDAFDERTTAVLSELAETVAYAIDARETKRGLVATGGTELKLVIRDAGSFLNDVAAVADDPVEVVEIRPGAGETSEVFFAATGVSLADLEARRDAHVADLAAVSDREGDHVFRATVSDAFLSDVVVELGAVPHGIEAAADETTLTVVLLPHVDAREFVDRLRDRYPTVELLERRERDARALSRGAFLDEFESLATDRQIEVLRTAYESGYFERPRESTGRDVADRLGVSQPTVNYHLRESQRRLLSLLFDPPDGRPFDGER